MWELLPKTGFVRKHSKTQTKAFLISERIRDTRIYWKLWDYYKFKINSVHNYTSLF